MDQICQYHLEHEGVPEYINALEDAQKMTALWDKSNEIADGTLLLIASMSILKSQRFPRAKEKWENLTKDAQKWEAWKVLYKDAHAKDRINKSATTGDQFGAAHEASGGASIGANRQEATPHREAENDFDGGTTEMEVFFDNLAALATNDKAVLAQLADSNTKLVNINEELSASAKRLTNETKQLQQ